MSKLTELARSTFNRDQVHIPVSVCKQLNLKDKDLILWLLDEETKQIILDVAVIARKSEATEKELKA